MIMGIVFTGTQPTTGLIILGKYSDSLLGRIYTGHRVHGYPTHYGANHTW